MRPFEIFLIIALGLLLLQYAWPQSKRMGRWQYALPGLTLLTLLLHVVLEKTRWQMSLAYGPAICLAALSPLVSLRAKNANTPWQSCLKWLGKLIGLHLAGLGLIITLVASIVVPVFRIPEPTGLYAIGTQDFYWVDDSRLEKFTSDPNDPRELMVRVWYPADPARDAAPRPYWPEVDRVGPLILERMGLPTFFANHMDLVTTHSYLDAPLYGTASQFPMLIFSHGFGGDDYERHLTVTEELASHGYVVFSISHTYETLYTVFPDGRIALEEPMAFDSSLTHSYGPLSLDDRLGTWVADAGFVLDQIEMLNAGETESQFKGRLDMARVGVFGVSFGGAKSMEFCLIDSRCKAGANLDGSQFGYVDFYSKRLQTPFLFFYNERSQGTNDHVYRGVENWAYRVTIKGTMHLNFSDAVLWSPYLSELSPITGYNLGPIDAERMIAIQRAYLLAFFNRHLNGEYTPFLDGPSAAFPEVGFEFRVGGQ